MDRNLLGRRDRSTRTAWMPVVAVGVVVGACGGDFPQSALHPASDFAVQLNDLYMTIVWWAIGVFVVVEAALLWTIIRYRERPNTPDPKPVHGSTILEFVWTLAPVVVLVAITVPTIRTIMATTGEPTAGALEVEVIGHQWWWEYHYPELGITTANEMHLPVGRRVALSMTSADVIHSFWSPRLGGKRDVIPGRTTRLAFTPDSVGVFPGQCAEFCGESHANMGLEVIVDDAAGFERWVAQQQAVPENTDSLTGLVRQGFEFFGTKGCLACHTIREAYELAAVGPDLTHIGGRRTIAGGILPTSADGLTRWLRDPPAEKPGSLMPRFPLSEAEISALVAYLMSLR